MPPIRPSAAVLAGAALVVALGAGASLSVSPPATGSGTDVPDHLVFSGLSHAGDQHAVLYHSLGAGAYQLGYAMDVQFTATRESTLLSCGLLDPNGVIDYLRSQSFQVVNQGSSHVSYSGRFRLPELTLKLLCVTNQTDTITVDFTDLSLSVQGTSELRS